MSNEKIRVLFVCMGNICRSPTAEGVFRTLIDQRGLTHMLEIDSAGTHAYHVGERPDPRACQVAEARGVDLRRIRARKVKESDFPYFDYILAMDSDNHSNLLSLSGEEYSHKVSSFMTFSSEYSESDVPDPYYGGTNGFERVFWNYLFHY